MSVKAELQNMIEDTRDHKLGQQKTMGIASSYQSTQNIGQGPEVLCYVVAHTGKTVLNDNALPSSDQQDTTGIFNSL